MPVEQTPADPVTRAPVATTRVEKPARPGVFLPLLALLVALAALGASGWLWWQDYQTDTAASEWQQDFSADLRSLDTGQRQLAAQLQALQGLEREATAQRAALQAGYDALNSIVKEQTEQLATLQRSDRNDWVLAEADYLMKLAHQRLLMGGDTGAATELLASADGLLQELDDGALFAVREQLAQDRAALQSVGTVDLEGIYLRLDALARRAEQLPLLPALDIPEPADSETAAQGWGQRLQAGFSAAWERLKDYIRIRRSDVPVKPLLAPDQEAALRQHLRLNFEQAQLALLAGKPALYRDSLGKAQEWIRRYLSHAPDAAALLDDIDAIAQRQVTVELPDISGSRQALKQYRARRDNGVQP